MAPSPYMLINLFFPRHTTTMECTRSLEVIKKFIFIPLRCYSTSMLFRLVPTISLTLNYQKFHGILSSPKCWLLVGVILSEEFSIGSNEFSCPNFDELGMFCEQAAWNRFNVEERQQHYRSIYFLNFILITSSLLYVLTIVYF